MSAEKIPCAHCGDDCGKYPVIFNEKPFCCHGCKTVYELLGSHQMDRYYEIKPMAGVKVASSDVPANEKYAFLDLDEIKEKLVDFSEGGIVRVHFFIPSIHCASCIWLLENLHRLHPGIVQSMVNFPKKEVTITFREADISLRQVVELMASVHYVPEIGRKPNTDHQKKANKTLLVKIGIAGFSFMNAMLYHFPQYLPGNEFLEDDFRLLFGVLSVLLSIPVLVYSANDYFLTAWKSLRKKIISIDLPIAIGLVTLFIQSLIEIYTNVGIGYLDSLNGLVFFMLIGKWYQGKTYQALAFERDYKSYFPVAVTLVEADGKMRSIPLEELRPGQKILVRNQELIPADSVVVEGMASIDYSFVTGESRPVFKNGGEMVFAGGKQTGSALVLEVKSEVEQSYLTQLWNQDRQQMEQESRLNALINRVSQYFTITILLIASGSWFFWFGSDPGRAIFAFTSVLIIACPCALALTVPFTLGSSMRIFGRKGFYLKNTHVLEQMTKIDTIVFDKTGTITQTEKAKVVFIGSPLSGKQTSLIRSAAKHSSHPLSRALFEALPETETLDVAEFTEIPSMGYSCKIDGQRINIGSSQFVQGVPPNEKTLQTQVWVSVGGAVLGAFQFENQYREGLQQVIQDLAKAGYKLHLISGDNAAERENLQRLFPAETQVHFNQSPTDKLEYIRKLKNKGAQVLMIGDGLNDAGALNESTLGLVVADNIYHFSPACDAIVQSARFESLFRFIRFSFTARKIVKLSFALSFFYNLIGLSFAVQGTLSPIVAAILMPLSSVSVVAFATFSVGYMARKSNL